MPTGHAEHCDAFTDDHQPAGHTAHAAMLVAVGRADAVPAGHAAHDDEPDPAALSVPAGHCSQMALPAPAN